MASKDKTQSTAQIYEGVAIVTYKEQIAEERYVGADESR